MPRPSLIYEQAMSDDPRQNASGGDRRPLHVVVYAWGVGVLLVGLASAGLVYVFAGDDRDSDAAREIASGRMYEHNLEMIGGKLNVYLVQFNDWFASLWHGTSLAYTIAVLSVAIALACFWIAHLMATAPPNESQRERRS
jgi:hypothetical protein